MDAEEVASPQPIFPSGSTVTAAIPLLAESPTNEPGELESDGDEIAEVVEAAPDDESPASDVPSIEVESEPASSSAGVMIVDDGIVQSDDSNKLATVPPTQEGLQDDLENPTPADTNAVPTEVDEDLSNENPPEPVSSTTNQESAPITGLPPGVDLQKLLSTFSTMTDLPTVEQAIPPRTSDDQVSQPTERVVDMPRPTVPWQIPPKPIPAQTPAKTNVPSQPSEDTLYEQFLVDEKRIMGNTAPHEFEPDSRLFIGNMTMEKTSKREIFLMFKKYGKLAQVSLKPNFGFVQFLTARECRQAIDGEQGRELAGKNLHLEVCKPQPRAGTAAAPRRRSRSPARKIPTPASYERDSYDSYRRASPPRRVSPGRFHNPQDAYYPTRRSPSPRRYAPPPPLPVDPLPPRYGNQVPEVQIVVLDQSDRSYIHWVETSIRQASFKVETLFLSPQLELPVVVRQMAKEGVLAIVHCHRQLQMANKVTLQVFDRSQAGSVRFDEYAGLDITAAIAVLKRSQQQAYASRAPIPAPAPPQQANLAAMIAQMDPASLQQVIGALSQQQQRQSAPPPSHPGSYPYRRY